MATPVDGAQSTYVEDQGGNVPIEGTPPLSGTAEGAIAPPGSEAITLPPAAPSEQAVPQSDGVPSSPPFVDALSARGEQETTVAQSAAPVSEPTTAPQAEPAVIPPATVPSPAPTGESVLPPMPQEPAPNVPVSAPEIPVHHTEAPGVPAVSPAETVQPPVAVSQEPTATPLPPSEAAPAVPVPDTTAIQEPYGLDEHFGHAPSFQIKGAKDLLKPTSDDKLAASLEEIVSNNAK